MRQNVRVSEQLRHLDQIDADLLKRMIELKKLRKAIRSIERSRTDPRLIDRTNNEVYQLTGIRMHCGWCAGSKQGGLAKA
jgi:hypothetical protein